VRRLNVWELHTCVRYLDEASILCAKDTSLGAANVAQMLYDVAGHYRQLYSEEQNRGHARRKGADWCQKCDEPIRHPKIICDDCLVSDMASNREEEANGDACKGVCCGDWTPFVSSLF